MTDRDDEFKKRIEAELLHSKNEEAAKNALALLFPSVQRVIKTYVSSDSDVKFLKAGRRISQRDFAEAYFSLNPDTASWGRSEFERLIAEGPEVAFAALESRTRSSPIAHRARLRRLFLELLDAAFSTTLELTQAWLDQLIAQSPKLLLEKDPSAKSMFTFDNEDRLRWLITNAIERLSMSHRLDLLKGAIRRASDLTVLTDVVRGIVGDKNPEGARDRGDKSDFGNDAEAIRALLLDRIRRLVPRGKIWSQSRPSQLLWFWWGSDLQAEVHTFTKRAMKTKRGLLGLLDAPIGVVNSSSEGLFERVNRSSWSKIVDIDELIARAKQLAKFGTSQSERDIATRFLNAVARDTGF
jgi:hypothetical protein